MFGGGTQWGKLVTTNYTKEAIYPLVAAGKDISPATRLQAGFFREENEITHYPALTGFVTGANQVLYAYSCHCGSGVNGVEIQLWHDFTKHIFFRGMGQVFRFHETVTQPYEPSAVAIADAQHHFGGSLTYQVGWRF
jgi:hypothetical protein